MEVGDSGRAVDTIICDVGDVLILFSPRRSLEIERRYGIRPGDLLDAVLKAPPARGALLGRLSQDDWFEQVGAIVGRAAVQDWLAYHGELNLPVVDILLAARRRGIRVLLLSNATKRLWQDLDHHGIRTLADEVYCSADIGLAKPDPRVYEFVFRTASTTADRTLYVDDTASWVDVGSSLGMYGYVYGTPNGLRLRLAALGVAV